MLRVRLPAFLVPGKVVAPGMDSDPRADIAEHILDLLEKDPALRARARAALRPRSRSFAGTLALVAGTVLGIVAVVREGKLACNDDKLCTDEEFEDVEAIEPIAHAATATIAW